MSVDVRPPAAPDLTGPGLSAWFGLVGSLLAVLLAVTVPWMLAVAVAGVAGLLSLRDTSSWQAKVGFVVSFVTGAVLVMQWIEVGPFG